MKKIIITGPSGSGKTFLANKLSRYFNNSIVIKTDGYYRDNIFIKLLSKFMYEIYDRKISIKIKELKKTIQSINNNENTITLFNYDFKNKKSTRLRIKNQNKNSYEFLIIEGIFSHRLDINYKRTINIICNNNKEACYQRRIKRDNLERGESRNEVDKKFNKSWNLFFSNLNFYINNNQVYDVNPFDNISYEQLISNLKIII